MPRWSKTMRDDKGQVIGRLCGHSRYRKCSTPGCTRHADRECDHPVQRKVSSPKVGDTRVHKQHKQLYYVRSINGAELTISTSETCGVLQVVSLAEWNEKADATCDRPICGRCAVNVEGQDWCQAHARAGGVV